MGKILLFGDSILMLGLAAQLKGAAGLEVLHIARADMPAVDDLRGLEAAIVDLNTGPLGAPLSLFRACPGLLLLGLDSANSSLTVLSGPSHPVQSAEEVLACIACHLHYSTPLGGNTQPHYP